VGNSPPGILPGFHRYNKSASRDQGFIKGNLAVETVGMTGEDFRV